VLVGGQLNVMRVCGMAIATGAGLGDEDEGGGQGSGTLGSAWL
jgi:hypothetical protein